MRSYQKIFFLRLLPYFLILLFPLSSFAQRGKDGAKTISTATVVVNEYTRLTANAASGATSIKVNASSLNANGRFPGNLAAGDLIMIIQMQGANISGAPASWNTNIGAPQDSTWGTITNYNNCGNWEFSEVNSVPDAVTINLECPLINSYTGTGRTVVVRVPRYTSLTINSGGLLSCDNWTITTGGVCAIEVQNNTVVNSGGSIDVTGKGFRGGTLLDDSTNWGVPWLTASQLQVDGEDKGESIVGFQTDYTPYGGRYCKGAPANGGGGGNAQNAGGGGGGNGGNPVSWNGWGNPDNSVAGWTTAWNLQWAGFATNTSSGGGVGGYTFSSANQNPLTLGPNSSTWTGDQRRTGGGWGGRPLDYSTGRLFLGGGGGSGEQNNNFGGAGGNGGGLIYLMNYGTISGAGQIISNGAAGQSTHGPAPPINSFVGDDGAGGGGAGGTIILNSVGAISGVSLTANGGKGGDQLIIKGSLCPAVNQAFGPGGGGGGGYIAISNGAPAQTVNGGANGICTADVMKNFLPNGATIGGAGTTNGLAPTNFVINAPNVTICAGQSATLNATLNGTVPNGTIIVWYDSIVAGNVLGNGNAYTTPVLTAGTYTYYVGTCPGTYHQPVIVTVTNSVIISAGPDVTICTGGNTTLTANGGTSYVWSPATGLNNPNISNPIANPASTTTYVVTGTSACGTANDTVIVNVSSSLSASISGNTTICSGGNTTLTASGGNNYLWNTNATTSSIVVSPTTNTNYSVTVSSGSCSNTASITVTVSSNISANISGNTTICTGGNTTLTASGGNNYLWNTNATTSSITVSPTTNTNYTVTVSNGNCSTTASVTVTVSSNISANISGNTTICSGGNTTLTASGGNNYSWNNSQTTSSIVVSPTTNTSYSVLVTNGNCSSTASITVTWSSNISASISGSTVICSGGNATITANGGNSFLWSTGATTATVNVPAGNYSVTVSSGNCSSTAAVNITASPTMTLSVSSTTTPCGQNGGTASATVNGGTGSYTYLWNPTGQTMQTATGLGGGNYSVTVSDAAGCTQTGNTTIISIGTPIANISGNTLLCTGDATTLTASGGTNYSWSNGSTSTTLVITPSATVSYTLTAFNGACSDTEAVTITVSPPPTASIASNTTICKGSSATLTANGGGNYSWNTGQTSSAISVSPTANSTYSVVVSIGSCSDSANATVSVVPVPTPTITATNILICGGDITTLTATGGNTYLWNSGQSGAVISVSPSATTTYTVTSGNGVCSDTSSIVITVKPPPTASITGNNNVCTGTTATLSAHGGGTYSWSSGQTSSAITTTTAGTYSVVVAIGSCTDTAKSIVIVNPLPTATVNPPITIIQGQNANLSAGGGVNYVWDNGMNGGNITVSPMSTTNYCVTVYDNNGCQDSACTEVIVELCSKAGTLYLPNAFSPNNDGNNDSLQIYYGIPACIKSLHLVIYNRWGEKVFETSDPLFRWNGDYKNSLLKGAGETEVLSFYMDADIMDGTKISRRGNISLIR